jgi:acetyl/propionyl-CoA carboxylase alpha subunit/acetyl-CoA carboxylase carboxyltransferase component
LTATLRRIAVVNRGEPAMRFLNAAKALRWERRLELKTVALYTDVDRQAWFVREADEAVSLGPTMRTDPTTGRLRHAYLDLDLLAATLAAAHVDAAWVGWGFVAEDPAFAELCASLGITFIGPSASAMRRLGDKIEAKHIAERAGVPIAPWSGGPVDERTAAARGEAIGYPLLVKAAAGGGGRGIRLVGGPHELASAITAAAAEAAAAFGDGTVYLEALLPAARHVEVQVAADQDGTTWALGVRDCSVQRRRQKVIEESASTALDDETRDEIARAAVRMCEAAGYRNVGTVEFLYSAERSEFVFMEVNARLQVEHTVTEAVTGVDLVRLQIDLASGRRLTGRPPDPLGHAVEVRLNAEDPDRGFAPAPGRVSTLRLPQGPGIRVDAGVVEGDVIPADFDSMIAKVVAWGRDRDEAIARLRAALEHSLVIVDGGATNRPLLMSLLDHRRFRDGDFDTAWLDDAIERGDVLRRDEAGLALVAATLEAYDVRFANDLRHFVSTSRRGRPDVRRDDEAIEVTYSGRSYAFFVYQLDQQTFRIRLASEVLELTVERFGPHEVRLRLGGDSRSVVSRRQGSDYVIEVGNETHRIQGSDAGTVRAPAPAVIVAVGVQPGQDVRPGDTLLVLEAMKMETAIAAPVAGRVREVLVHANSQVDAGDVLVRLEPDDGRSDGAGAGAPVTLADAIGSGTGAGRVAAAGVVGVRPSAVVRRVRALRRVLDALRGFDLEPTEPSTLLADLRADDDATGELLGSMADEHDLDTVLILEDDVLDLFAEVSSLASRRPIGDIRVGAVERGQHEHLLAYLRAPQRALPTLPADFVEQLTRLVRPHGVSALEREDVDAALLRVYSAVHALDRLVPHVTAVLDRRLQLADVLVPRGRGLRSVDALDRLIAVTEATRPTVSEHARAVRYRYVEQPVLRTVRDAAMAEVDILLGNLVQGATTAEMQRLAASTHRLHNELVTRLWSSDTSTRALLLEVLLRRTYPEQAVTDIEVAGDTWPVVVARFVGGDGPRTVVAGCRPLGELRTLLRDAHTALRASDEASERELGAPTSDGEPDAVLDLVVLAPGPLPEAEGLAARLADDVRSTIDLEPGTRVDLTVHTATRDAPMRHASFARHDGRLEEVEKYRELHPALARRLELWRLREFDLVRLASAEGIYLFHATARTNRRDERLFAIAEVRDLTPVLDSDGSPVAWPDLERTMVEALASIRSARLRRPLTERPIGNRITLYVRPEWTVSVDDLRRLAHRFAPAAVGIGLEKVVLRIDERDPATSTLARHVLHMTSPTSTGVSIGITDPSHEPIRPLTPVRQATTRTRRRGDIPPADIVVLLTSPAAAEADFPVGSFVELDLDEHGSLVEVTRPIGENSSGVVVGRISNQTERYPEGMERVIIMGDPAQRLGALAEPECRRIIAALDLADELGVPIEWFAVSSGARVAMDSGTENMDWTAAVLRRIIELTQSGAPINVVLTGVNVGAQSYFDAEATMLLHTRGLLVAVGDASMVLTGKQALDVSGAVSADDNAGIGGFEQVMGPNGEAHLWAPTIEEACALLFAHYEHSYVAPGERFPRPTPTTDPADRDIRPDPHPQVEGSSFTTVGEIFSATANPDRKRPFDIRAVMHAVVDRDHHPLETWARWKGAENAVVWDGRVGGHAVRLVGIESRNLERQGSIPADGPEHWSGGTLFPLSSKKVARAINAASGNRPVVVLANLSGFDGSPESMRELQLEYGAEIGRAVVNFDGPIVFCVVSRYHGGAFVVFSKSLNPSLEVAAIEGSRASVLGGAPAAAVVFAREVEARVRADGRVVALSARIEAAPEAERDRLRAELDRVVQTARSEALGEMASTFDAIHTIERARAVGSVDFVISARRLRPYVIDAVERGMRSTLPVRDGDPAPDATDLM